MRTDGRTTSILTGRRRTRIRAGTRPQQSHRDTGVWPDRRSTGTPRSHGEVPASVATCRASPSPRREARCPRPRAWQLAPRSDRSAGRPSFEQHSGPSRRPRRERAAVSELPIQLPIQGTGLGGAECDSTRRGPVLSRPNTTGRDWATPSSGFLNRVRRFESFRGAKSPGRRGCRRRPGSLRPSSCHPLDGQTVGHGDDGQKATRSSNAHEDSVGRRRSRYTVWGTVTASSAAASDC